VNASWTPASQRAIAGWGELTDFAESYAATIPPDVNGMPVTVITTANPTDVATFATRHHIGASVDTAGRVYTELHFGAAILRIQAEGRPVR
jgi:hypothetical protein